MTVSAPSRAKTLYRTRRKRIGLSFCCLDCRKPYVTCKCRVYQSAFAVGRTNWRMNDDGKAV